MAKLTEKIVQSIIAAHRSGEMQKDIASRLQLSKQTVSSVITGAAWSFIEREVRCG